MKKAINNFLVLLAVTGLAHQAVARIQQVTEMTVQDLYDLSLQKKTIPATLEALPDIFKTNFTLVYNSPSMQGSTFQHPRAIMFNEDSSLVVTFNGDPEHRGYQHLEAVQFIKEEARWEFFDISFEDDTPRLSDPNPSTCLACHQYPARSKADPRPNWEPYNVWPNLYGSLGGTLDPKTIDDPDTYYSVPKLMNAEAQLPGFLSRQNQEADQLICFIRNQILGQADTCGTGAHDSSDRYQHLRLTVENRKSRINAGLHDLSRHLAENNFARVLRLMKEQPYYESVKYTLGAYLLGQAFSRALPAALLDYTNPSCSHPIHEENLNRLLSTHRAWQQASGGYYVALTADDVRPDRDRLNVTRYIDLLFGPRVGPEFMDWSMDFATGGKFLNGIQRRFRAAGSSAASFADVFFADEPEMKNMSCEEISQIANEKLSEAFRLNLLD